jgi:hypothetical protein
MRLIFLALAAALNTLTKMPCVTYLPLYEINIPALGPAKLVKRRALLPLSAAIFLY